MNTQNLHRYALPLVAGSLALIGSTGASAQTAPATDGATAAEDTFDIIVTAQKRSQNLTDVPISVTAVQSSALAENGLDSVMDLAQVVPALRVDQNGAYSAPTIRGVGSSIAGTGFSNNVAIYVDGFYNPSQSTTDSLFVNIESIEVLKGPQGTLFGRNATGGAILMRLREPSITPTAEGRISYGRYNSLESAIYASTGLTDTLAIDFSGAFTRSDGFLTNVVTGSDKAGQYKNYAVRSAILWKPVDGISFKLAYQHSESKDNRPYATGALEDPVLGTPMALGALLGAAAPTDRGEVANSGRTRFNSNVDGVYLTSVFDFGGAELKSYTMYRKEKTQNYLDLDSSSAPLFEGVFFLRNKTFSQEVNLSGSTDRLDWLAGLFYLRHQDSQGPFPVLFGEALTGAPGGVLVDLYSAGVKINAYAVYGDLTYRLTDKLFATVGMRYSYEESKAFWNLEPLAVAFGIGGGNPPGRVDFRGSWSSFTPRAVLRYEFTDRANIYASYSKGFKSGLLTPNGFDRTPLNPETINAYEIGIKYGGPRLRASLATFYYDYKNLQVAAFISGTGVYRNAATSEIYGAEGSVTAKITDELQLDAGVAYTHARYNKFGTSSQYVLNPLTGTCVANSINAAGFQMQRAPDWTGNVGVNWNKTVGDFAVGLNGNFYFTSKFPFDTAETFYEGGYSIVNIGAKFGAADGKWAINAYARNLFDTKYHTQILPGDFAIQQVYGEPLTYGVGLSFKF